VNSWRATAEKYQMQDLKLVARLKAPTRANWKLVIENFRECYHCYPAHTKSYSVVHQIYGDPSVETPELRARIDAALAKEGYPVARSTRTSRSGRSADSRRRG